jgi:SAM-dependent methyltransferase
MCGDIKFSQPSLDIGCGDGFIAGQLFNENFSHGIDNGEANDIQQGIDSGKYEQIIIGSAENIPLPDLSLNFVFSNCVLEHIPGLNSVIEEVGRTLKSGGKFLFTVPSESYSKNLFFANLFNRLGLISLANKYSAFRNRKLNHFNLYDISKWETLLSMSKIKIIKHEYYISPDDLSLWDLMAIQSFVGSILGIKLQGAIKKLNFKSMCRGIDEAHKNSNFPRGTCIAILAEKT